MSPVAPMPWAAWVGANGLNAWVMVVSGELSMTRVFPVVEALVDGLELELDEHALSPAASKQAAATAISRMGLWNLLISLVFLSDGIRL